MSAAPDFERVRAHFAMLHDRSPAEQEAGLEAIGDPALRAEVASLLEFDGIDAPFIQDAAIVERESVRAPPVVGLTLADRYEVQAEVGEGGFGWVHRGLDRVTGAPVALKIFKPITDPGAAVEVEAAFAREGAVLQSLADRTPHIVRYHGNGTFVLGDRRYIYLAMEWLDGPTLDVHRRDGPPMSLSAAMALLQPIAEALAVAHANGVAHRDLKPSNILCSGDPAAPILKLIDFGAAKRMADRARGFDSTDGAIGMVTYRYSAPEQLDKRHGSSGPWTDVHALALLLVELMAGRHPWVELDVLRTIEAVDAKVRPTPRRMGLDASSGVEAVFARALHRAPKRRHPDAALFWAALSAARAPRAGALWARLGGLG